MLAIKIARIELQKQLDLLQSLGDIDGKQHEEISGIISTGQPDIRLDANRGAETGDIQKTSSVPSRQPESGGRTGRDDSGRGKVNYEQKKKYGISETGADHTNDAGWRNNALQRQ